MNDDIHTLSGAYAVDALDDVERLRFERHLTACVDCRAEVQSLRTAAAELAHLHADAPPASLRAGVMARIHTSRPLPPLVDTGSSAPVTTDVAEVPAPTGAGAPPPEDELAARRHWWQAPQWLAAAAAAVVLAVGGGVAAWQPWQHQAEQQVTVAAQVLHAPDAQRTQKRLPIGGTATLVRSESVGKAVLVTHELPPPPADKVYELWLQSPKGQMKPAGLMSKGHRQTVVLEGDAATAAGAGITIEPAGGSPEPTTAPLVLFAFS